MPKRAPAARPHRTNHSGQSVVEFAIMLPVVMLLLIAIADFGRPPVVGMVEPTVELERVLAELQSPLPASPTRS